MKNAKKEFLKRKERTRNNLKKLNPSKLRLTVFRSDRHIEAQIIDDVQGITIVSYTSKAKDFKGKPYNMEGATIVGTEIAKRAKEAKIKEVFFDRGGYPYHGRVKALAEAARTAGLKI
ncbi:MAG: 50S ribosomal protein L18 [Rickettsiales bacterium]|jgi:large subunit ribosomal protein L18|nr:50S ribosomal protein L18 [Rickettsiales bacterium]